MKFDIITLFPEMIENYFNFSILKRAKDNNVIDFATHNPRDFSKSKHKKVDDTPYGGGDGMVLMCEPFLDAYNSFDKKDNSKTILLSPQGVPFTHKLSLEFSNYEQLIFICGHYEGFDERIRTSVDCYEVSIGDFVLTGGELPALCIIDSVTRNLEGALGKITSSYTDSFADGLLEYPQYTRPEDYNGTCVPEILLSGNHEKIALWRRKQQLIRTKDRRPDLFKKFIQKCEDKTDKKLIDEILRGE